ncbi:MAG: hypothetical protein HC929_00665 [Leptolyngbyaceae cyanobacterium SM2_5_2]|nr:hypothetical protein [Leptolyngbyaceae cyanobacterium SM2_5_2]
MAAINSSQSKSIASSRDTAQSSSRAVSRVTQQGAEVRAQSWARSASGEISHSEKAVIVAGAQSAQVKARAQATDDEATTACSMDS